MINETVNGSCWSRISLPPRKFRQSACQHTRHSLDVFLEWFPWHLPTCMDPLIWWYSRSEQPTCCQTIVGTCRIKCFDSQGTKEAYWKWWEISLNSLALNSCSRNSNRNWTSGRLPGDKSSPHLAAACSCKVNWRFKHIKTRNGSVRGQARNRAHSGWARVAMIRHGATLLWQGTSCSIASQVIVWSFVMEGSLGVDVDHYLAGSRFNSGWGP